MTEKKMYPLYYIKSDDGRYWHKYKLNWKDKRENVPAFTDLERLKKHLNKWEDGYSFNKCCSVSLKKTEYSVVCVYVTLEEEIEL